MTPFSAVAGVVLLLVAFVLYLLALRQVPQNNPNWQIDRVTTAQALVVLWLLLYVADGWIERGGHTLF